MIVPMNQISSQFYDVANKLHEDAMLTAHSEIAGINLTGATSQTRWEGSINSHYVDVFKQIKSAWEFVELERREPYLYIGALPHDEMYATKSYALLETEDGIEVRPASDGNPASFLLELLGVSSPDEVLPFLRDWTSGNVTRLSTRSAGINTITYLPEDRHGKEKLPYINLGTETRRDPTTGEVTRHIHWHDETYDFAATLSAEDAPPALLQSKLSRIIPNRRSRPVPEYQAASVLADLYTKSQVGLETIYEFRMQQRAQRLGELATQ